MPRRACVARSGRAPPRCSRRTRSRPKCRCRTMDSLANLAAPKVQPTAGRRSRERAMSMQFGLALPQYDYSIPGERPLSFETIARYARVARDAGFTSVWLSDHLFLDLAKYGGSDAREGCYEPLVTLAALARELPDVRLGTLVLLEALRPAPVLAKSLATLDRVCDGRLDVGLGAGWYEPDYEAIGLAMPPPGERLARLREAVEIVSGMLGGETVTYAGDYHRARHAAAMPPALQQPRP